MLRNKINQFLFIGTILLNPSTIFSAQASENSQQSVSQIQLKQSGLNLDIARHFYSVEVLKKFIDNLKNSGGTFLQLHFSDHENYALESAILNQRAENSRPDKNGIYINPQTHKPFLTFAQLSEIIHYAKTNGIEIVPELGTPNHMNGIFKLLELHKGKNYVRQLKSNWSDEEIDIPQGLNNLPPRFLATRNIAPGLLAVAPVL